MAGRAEEFNADKFRELVLYLSERSQLDEGFGATKLNKLLYFCDFEAFRQLGSPITGATYQKLEWGPAAREFLPLQDDLLRWEEVRIERVERGPYVRRVTVALRRPDLAVFSEAEQAIIDRVIEELRAYDATGASEYSHEQSAGWNAVEEGDEIPYRTALIATNEIPSEDVERAAELARERDWASIHP